MFSVNGRDRFSQEKGITINWVLSRCNFFVILLITYGFFRDEVFKHPYVNESTLFLALILCVQTQVALWYERKSPDPFVLILSFLLVFFYELRVFTLLLYPYQDVFERFDFSTSDSNFALFYMILANCFIYLGLYLVKLRKVEVELEGFSPKVPTKGVLLFCLSFSFGAVIQEKVPEIIAPILNMIYGNFLTPHIVWTVLAVFVFVFRNSLPRVYMKLVLGGALILAISQTIAFSRSGLLTLVTSMFVLICALLPTIQFPRRYVYFGFAVIPLFVAAAFTLFAISTTTRAMKGEEGATISEKVELFHASRDVLKDDPRTDFFIGQALARAGYFDFSAEILANSKEYNSVFSVANYFKSVVDNIISPGFDVFDQPRISSSLKYVYHDLGVPSRKDEMEAGHSDQLGIYGEMYALFGYASFVVLFFFAYFLKKLFCANWGKDPAELALVRVLLATLFFRLINSYGFDWHIWDLMILFISFIMIHRFVFNTYEIKNAPVQLSHQMK